MKYDISIIIPFFNVEPYIDECLSSILRSKTGAKYEILLIDDGSTDASLEIARGYAENNPDIKVLSCPAGRPSAARNLGCTIASGKYIYYIDSDDKIEKDYLESLYHTAEKNDAEVVYAGFRRLYDSSKLQETVSRDFLKNHGVHTGLDVLDMRMDSNDWNNQVWCGLYNKSFLVENSIFFPEDFIVYEDILYSTLVLINAKRVALIENDGYLYRMREKSLVSGGPKLSDIETGMNLIERFLNIYPMLDLMQRKACGRVLFQIISMILYYVGSIRPENAREIYKNLKSKEVMDILKASISNKKEFVKYMIFKYCMRLYYCIVK